MSFSILIPYVDIEKLGKCVRAIRRANQIERIIAIFDDLEGTGVLPRDGTLGPNVDFHMGRLPYIGSRTGNDGMRLAGADDVVLMGDDVVLVNFDCLTRLAKTAGRNPQIGILAPSVYGLTLCAAQQIVSIERALPLPTSNVLPVTSGTVPFICVYLRREVYEKVGPFDEDFTEYGFDDNDYCIRVRAAGYALAIEYGSLVDHQSVPSTWHPHGLTEAHLSHNREVFYRKYPELRPRA